MISTAPSRAVAGRIASVVNSGECWACHRPVDHGVFAFGASGSDARWYPSRAEAEAVAPTRFIYDVPATGETVTPAEIEEWLAEVRPQLENLLEELWREREAKRVARDVKRSSSGFATSVACGSCGKPKSSPAERCYHCGDEPVPWNADAHDYNRAHGFQS
jgi:hypothetical protein